MSKYPKCHCSLPLQADGTCRSGCHLFKKHAQKAKSLEAKLRRRRQEADGALGINRERIAAGAAKAIAACKKAMVGR